MAPKKSTKNPGDGTVEVGKSENESFKKTKGESKKSALKNEIAVIDLVDLVTPAAHPLTRGAMKRILQNDIKPECSRQTSKQNRIQSSPGKKKRAVQDESPQIAAKVDGAAEAEVSETPKTNDKRKRKSDPTCRAADVSKKLRSKTEIESISESYSTKVENSGQAVYSHPAIGMPDSTDNSEQKDEETFKINELPPELLTEILSHLSFRDLQNARLVCQHWYDAANVMEFVHDEKLLCYALYDLNIIIQTLTNSKRKYLNLEFYDLKFENYPITFWEKCGKKIGSLLFSDCDLPDETIEKIIVHCDKLEKLSLEFMPSEYKGQKFCSEDTLLRLINAGVVRKNLTFLDLNMLENGWVSNNLLKLLFTIFPCICKFLFYFDTVEDDFNIGDVNDEELLRSSSKCTFSSILKVITDSADVLEELFLDLGDYRSLDAVPSAAACEALVPLTFNSLADIKIDIDLLSMPQQRVIEFFARHKKLAAVECQILFEDNAEFTSQLLVCLVDNCPDLQFLHLFQDAINLYRPVDISPALFSKLANSRLESLSVNFCLNVTAPETLPVNNTLLSLSILSSLDCDGYSIFFKTFRSLRHLEVNPVDDNTLLTLFKYQTELTSLKLIDCQNCSDYGFTGRMHENCYDAGCSIRRLTKLEYLEFKMYAFESNITNVMLSELVFPNLKYLHVTIDGIWEFHTALVNTLYSFPLLEGIYFMVDQSVEYSIWLSLCNNLKRLRYLLIDNKLGCEVFRDEAYEAMFASCPSLRVFRHRNENVHVSYYYDTINKTVVKKMTEQEQYRVSTEEIDTFSVNWLWF